MPVSVANLLFSLGQVIKFFCTSLGQVIIFFLHLCLGCNIYCLLFSEYETLQLLVFNWFYFPFYHEGVNHIKVNKIW